MKTKDSHDISDKIEKEILEEIKCFKDTDILCINYDWDMGLSIEGWSLEDQIVEVI